MKENTLIFVCFDLEEESQSPQQGLSWQGAFVKNIATLLFQPDDALSGAIEVISSFDVENENALANKQLPVFSAVILLPRADGLPESERFMIALQALAVLNDKNAMPVFCVMRRPGFLPVHYFSLRFVKSYGFYEYDEEIESCVPYENRGLKASRKYWQCLDDLITDVSLALKPNNPEPRSFLKVYVTACPLDVKDNRDSLLRFLKRENIEVLPRREFDLSQSIEAIESSIFEAVTEADFIIQMIGGTYGELIPGLQMSLDCFENEAIYKKLSSSHKERLMWLKQNNMAKDVRQKTFIEHVRLSYANRNDTLLLECGINDLLESAMAMIQKEKKQSPINLHKSPKESVLFIYSEEEAATAATWAVILEEAGFSVTHPPFEVSGNKKPVLRLYLDLLKKHPKFLLYYSGHNAKWLEAMLVEIEKTAGYSRLEQTFKKKTILMPSNAQADFDSRLRATDYEILTLETHKIDFRRIFS